jgi:AmmeMemoRadiSam system protein A
MAEKQEFPPEARREMLELAHAAVEAAVKGEGTPQTQAKSPELALERGIFVTLRNGAMLRGCLGRFEADVPLATLVPDMAGATARQDPRFFGNPITSEELPEIDIKISVLSPLRKVSSADEVQVGEHGIQVRQGWRSGCYLPEVATDYNMSREEFLSSCCADKAGLPADAWKSPETEILVFTTESFGDEDI